jgi:hypothetical protein
MWENKLLKIGVVRFKLLATLLHQHVEGGIDDVALVEVRSIVAKVPTLHAWRAWSTRFASIVSKNVFANETNKSQELLLKTWANQTVRFCQDKRQSGALSNFDGVLLLYLSGVWMVQKYEPQQLWRLKRWLRDPIDEKKRKLENYGKNYEK